MFNKGIELLLVDDDKSFLELEASFLERYMESPSIEFTTSPVEALDMIDESLPDAVVSDYQMPQMTGQELLESIRSEYSQLPFIMFTGEGSEEVASEAISAEVTDYLQKSPNPSVYELLANRIDNAVHEYRDAKMKTIFKSAVENVDENVVVTDVDGKILYANPAFTEFTGYEFDEILGENPRILSSGEHDEEFYKELWDTILDGQIWSREMINKTKDGSPYMIKQKIIPISYGSERYFVAVNMPL